VVHREVFPGLRLAVAKMLAGDDAGVLAELEAGQVDRGGAPPPAEKE
jgi:hypothetical protein